MHRASASSAFSDDFAKLVDGLRRAFVELDASLIEINPLAVASDGVLLALDVKMIVDDNALFRQLPR